MTAGQIVTGPGGEKITLGEIGQTVLLDNDRIRVWEVALAPTESQPWHLHHNPYLVLCLESSPCHMDWLDGAPPRHIVETLGGVVFRPPSPVHMLTNDGGEVYRNRLVELKDLGEEAVGNVSIGATEPTEPLSGLPIVFDSDETRVYEIDLAPGGRLSLPADIPACALITLSGTGPDGDVSYYAPGSPKVLTNTGGSPYAGRLIELKYLEENR